MEIHNSSHGWIEPKDGCLLWFGDLIDIRDYREDALDLYVRMASSELGKDYFLVTTTANYKNAISNALAAMARLNDTRAVIFPVVQKQHQLLVILLLCNAAAMEALPLYLDKIFHQFVAILLSVTFVLFFGESLLEHQKTQKKPLQKHLQNSLKNWLRNRGSLML